jgi:hypothetical protein
MMNNYLFETYRGQFNWNKLMRKSMHLFGYFHVHYLMSYVITLNVTACRCMNCNQLNLWLLGDIQ